MNRPLGLSSVVRLQEYARRQEIQTARPSRWVKAWQIARNAFAGIGAAVVFFGGIAMTSDERRPALISVAELRRLISTERMQAVKEAEEALKAQPEPGSLRGFFTLPRKTS